MRNRLTYTAEQLAQRGLHQNMPIVRFLSWPHLRIAFAYVAGYVVLDWVSFVHPIAGLGITPWNPHPGLSFALILLFGREFLPWLLVAPLVADAIVRDSPLPLWAECSAALIIGIGYGAATTFLTSRVTRFDVKLESRRDILMLIVIAASAAGFVAFGYVTVATVAGLLDSDQFVQAALRYWIGDTIGIVVVTPFLLVLFTRRRFPALSWELLGPLVLLLMALWLVTGVETFRFQLFYLLFLPIIWTAVRFGFEMVTLALAVTQLALIAAIHVSGQSAVDVTAFQALMVVLALTGLAVGVLVTEQQRTQRRLQLHQEALARVTRLSSMGELAATLAHELNQPLAAIANYTRLAHEAARSPARDASVLREATGRAVEQVDRAADVVRRLREFVRLGRSEITRVSMTNLASQVRGLIRVDLEQHGIVLNVEVPNELPRVNGDALQLEQVILNLLRNSIESIADAGRYDGRITVSAASGPDGFVTVSVHDNGPGFDPNLMEQLIAPFTTTKPEGMGLGLALCRSIIEAHGGKFWLGGGEAGATVSFTLPIAGSAASRAAQ